MRLTLRTLLAYLDNILDPADAESLGNKIDESEFATSLVHQIRGSVRRLRLDAPALDAQGVGGDLNSVAEYLDNVLPPDQVPSLEKACLDDEVNLGEVASCHQILTLVLGEASPVTDKMRHRAYGISPTVAVTELPSPAASPTSRIESHSAPVPPPVSSIVSPPSNPPSTGTASTLVAGISNKVALTPPAESRPSRRFAPRVDAPSTKETWRAESSSLNVDQPEQPEQPVQPEYPLAVPVAAVVTAAPAASPVTLPAPRDAYPDYMPRKSSWLRSAFITGIVALLILAGLLFATGSIRDNLLTRWLGKSQKVVSNRTTNSTSTADMSKAELTPVAPSSQVALGQTNQTNQTTQVTSTTSGMNVVSPNRQQPERASSSFDRLPSFDNPPKFDDPPLSPIEPEQATAFSQSNDVLPELLESNGFRDPIETPENGAEASLPDLTAEANTDVSRTADSNPAPAFEDPTANDLATGEPEVNLDTTVIDRAAEEDLLPEVVVTMSPLENSVTNESSFENVAPSDFETGLAEFTGPTAAESFDTQSNTTDSTLLERAGVAPPVASTAPDVGDLAASTQLPREATATTVPRIPEPDFERTMEPTKLKRDDQLLLLFDDESKSWVQVDSRVQLQANDHLLGLPAFKSEIEIGSGMTCTTHGVARLRLGPGSDISLIDGNIVLSNQEANQSQEVRFHGKQFEVQLIDPGTTVAVEAYHERIPGSDISETPHSILRIYPLDNSISVAFMGQTFDLMKGRHLIMVDEFEPRVRTSKSPKWMSSDKDTLSRLDRNATRAWKTQLGKMSNLQAWLQNKAEATVQVNQRSLASRSLAEMDDFAAIVASLHDVDQHAYWTHHVDTLRRALTRGPEVQQLVRVELEQAYGSEQTEIMMEMLRGYNAKQLGSDGAAKLVRYLAHSNPELRLLAIGNLTRITNKNLGYHADAKLGIRSAMAEKWRKRLKGGIAYAKTPELVKLLESFGDVE